MREIRDKSCIDFIQHTDQDDFISILSSDRSHSSIGRQNGNQTIFLYKKQKVGAVLHELMHALGFEHEHNRPDRDNYIYIDKSNLSMTALIILNLEDLEIYIYFFSIYNHHQIRTFSRNALKSGTNLVIKS